MKNTTRVLAAALIAALVSPTLQNCKKGEGDPFLSLKSRKSRVAGEWTVSALKDETTTTSSSTSGGSTSSSSETMVIDVNGSSVKITNTSTDEGGNVSMGTGTGAANVTATFEKDGTFRIISKFTNVTMNYDGDEAILNMSTESSGTWNFLGGVEEDFKNKERMILNYAKEVSTISESASFSGTTFSYQETRTDTYANGENSEIWQLNTLKGKEMVVEGTKNSTGNYSTSFSIGSTSDTETGTSSEKGTFSATLMQ